MVISDRAVSPPGLVLLTRSNSSHKAEHKNKATVDGIKKIKALSTLMKNRKLIKKERKLKVKTEDPQGRRCWHTAVEEKILKKKGWGWGANGSNEKQKSRKMGAGVRLAYSEHD